MPGITEAKFEELEKKVSKILEKVKLMDDINKNTQILHRNLEFLSKEFDSFKKKLEDNVTELASIKKKNALLEAENLTMRNDLKQLRAGMEEMLYDQRSNEMEIAGLPEGTTDNLESNLVDYAQKMNCKINSNDIKKVNRLNGKNGKHGTVVVSFANKDVRDRILTNLRKAKPTGKDFGFINCNSKIFLNESLPSYTRYLLYNTRCFKRDHNWKYIWVKNGKIFLRKEDKAPAVNVLSVNDLEVLMK